MSATTGIWLLRAIAGSASASSWLGQATRTMSQPAAVSSAICCRVEFTSAVSVVVIDCTLIGASPPTSTEPTLILREGRRGARTGGGAAGMPRETLMRPVSPAAGPAEARPSSAAETDRLDDVGVDQEHRHHDEHAAHRVGDGQQPGDVGRAWVGTVPEARHGPAQAL